MPGGHPEGYIEGFANLYRDAAELIAARRAGRAPSPALGRSTPNVRGRRPRRRLHRSRRRVQPQRWRVDFCAVRVK